MSDDSDTDRGESDGMDADADVVGVVVPACCISASPLGCVGVWMPCWGSDMGVRPKAEAPSLRWGEGRPPAELARWSSDGRPMGDEPADEPWYERLRLSGVTGE
jgi:hypothetical protein